VTLADLAADVRAPTPTAAAELAAPVRDDLLQALNEWARRLQRAQRQRIDRDAQGLDLLSSRLAHAVATLRPQRQRLDLLTHRNQAALERRLHATGQALSQLADRWQRAASMGLERRAARLAGVADRLGLLDPRQVLSRGFALIESEAGRVVLAPSQLRVGERLTVSLAQGQAELVPGEVTPRDG
ncbi:MAG TPA: exodeoxyribonuclease VII large subunit, partial [Burkholderiaceae bacterium]|nr:exodeoxyribonuclease VII large subunit [Burkholderiaceae bacterium]